MGNVAVVGSINMDLVVNAPRLPSLGETVIGHGFMTAPGGKGANQACAAARLGGKVRMLARVGDDAFGRQLCDHLEDSGVITHDVQAVSETRSGTATIVVHKGDNFIIIDPAANHRLTAEDVREFAPRIAEADIVLVQLEIPLEVVAETVRVSVSSGTPVLLNPAPAAELSRETLAGVTWLTPNEGEAALLAGRVPGENTSAELESTISALRRLGVANICVTLGGDGVAFTTPDGVIKRSPAEPVTPVDTTAAGDVFSGAFAVALTENKPVEEAVGFAQRASAISVTRAGAGPSIPTRAEVNA